MLIHDKIRNLREQQKWTQEEMAERAEMSKNGYAKIERGESKISLERLEKFAMIFDTDIFELLNQDKGYVYWGDHNGDNTNYYGTMNLTHEIEKLQLTLNYKNQLLIQKDNLIQQNIDLIHQKNNEIETLKKLVDLLESK